MSNSKETANQPVTACMLGYFLYDYDARIQNYVNILMKEGYSVDVIGLGKENYQVIAELRSELEKLLTEDMLSLHDVKGFLKCKKKKGHGFHYFSRSQT